MEEPIGTERGVFAMVANQMINQPKIARLAAGLAKNFKSTTSESLERAKNLAYLLYLYEQPNSCLQVCRLLHDITFQNNYNLWTWVELTLALEWKLHVDAGQVTPALLCADILRSTYRTGSEAEQLQKATILKRRLAGSLLYDAKIMEAQQSSDKTGERSYRMIQLGELLFIEALGGSEALPALELERQFAVNLAKLRGA